MGETTLFVSDDFVKNRPHIHYLMKRNENNNSVSVIGTYNSKKNTITLKEEAFAFCSVAEKFVELSLINERKAVLDDEICS